MKLSRKPLVAIAIVLAFVAVFAIRKGRGEQGTEVEMAAVAEHDVRPTILASGLLAWRNEVNLTSEVLARVEEILVKEGDTIHKDQLLLRLDPETYRNAIEREEASRRQSLISIERQRVALALREKQFKRSEQLLAARMIDQSRHDEERNQLELARIELKSSEESLRRAEAVLRDARELLSKTDIRSPIDGTVVALPIKVGETAIPSTSALNGAQMMKIADTSSIKAELKVDEADVAKIGIGQKIDLYAVAYPDTAIPGVIEQIALAPTVELTSQGRAYLVTATLTAPASMQLRSGMSARADIFLSDGSKLLAVPVEAVTSELDEERKASHHVWVVADGKARKTAVQTGASDDRWQQIVSGVTAGQSIVVGPAKTLRRLRDNEPVKAIEKDGKKDDKKTGAGDDA